jgi:hypothetical protein
MARANALIQVRAILSRSRVVSDAVADGRVELRVVVISSSIRDVTTYQFT